MAYGHASHCPHPGYPCTCGIATRDAPQACVNTDRELWREPEDKNGMSMANIFVTERGGIGMNIGGNCAVMPIREWFKLANFPEPKPQ